MCISEKMCVLCAGIVVGACAIGYLLADYYQYQSSFQQKPAESPLDKVSSFGISNFFGWRKWRL